MSAPLSESERFPLLTERGRKLLHQLIEDEHAPIWDRPCGDQLDARGLEQVRRLRPPPGCAAAAPRRPSRVAERLQRTLSAPVPALPPTRRRAAAVRGDPVLHARRVVGPAVGLRARRRGPGRPDRPANVRHDGPPQPDPRAPGDGGGVAAAAGGEPRPARRAPGVRPRPRRLHERLRLERRGRGRWSSRTWTRLARRASTCCPAPVPARRLPGLPRPLAPAGVHDGPAWTRRPGPHAAALPAVRAVLSSATALSPSLTKEMEGRLGCPILDVYALAEAGPIALFASAGMK